jgi:hypothetical protein
VIVPDVARGAAVDQLHDRLRVDLTARLEASVPDGWEVSAEACWPPSSGRGALRPDLVVHRTLEGDGRMPVPPVLCVDIAAGPADVRPAHPCARLGVDHHWHVDLQHGTLQVSVRVGDVYRRCESFSAESLVPAAASHRAAWVDFGVGVVQLDGLLLAPLTTALPG